MPLHLSRNTRIPQLGNCNNHRLFSAAPARDSLVCMESPLTPEIALAGLAWQIELGATEAIGDAPINRYELPEKSAKPAAKPDTATATPVISAPQAKADPLAEAERAAAAAPTHDALRAALSAYPHCDLRRGARNLVFCDGSPAARIMIIGEAPGRDEDLQGKPCRSCGAVARPDVRRHRPLARGRYARDRALHLQYPALAAAAEP